MGYRWRRYARRLGFNGLNATSPSNADGANGDPDGDGLINIYEYVNPSWTTTCDGQPCYRPGPDGFTQKQPRLVHHLGIGPGGCATLTAETDGITSTNPLDADTDNDGLNDSHEALTLLTDPTNVDTDGDGIDDGVEITGQYGTPPQASDPRNNNTDGDALMTVMKTRMGTVSLMQMRQTLLEERILVILITTG